MVNNHSNDNSQMHTAASYSIAAFIFNIIHNVFTILISRYRGDIETDVKNLKLLLCCYNCCGDGARCFEYIFSIFSCFCIVDLLNCECFDNFITLSVEILVQLISCILTLSLSTKSYSIMESNSKEEDYIIGPSFFKMVTIFFAAFSLINSFLCIICIIYQLTKCNRRIHNKTECSEKEDDDSNQGNINDNIQPPQPNQNQVTITYTVATIQNSNESSSRLDTFDPENTNNNQQIAYSSQNPE